MALSDSLAAFDLVCSSVLPLPVLTPSKRPRFKHFLPLTPVFLKHVECTSVMQGGAEVGLQL